MSLLKQIISGLPDVPVFVRTTVLPGTCDRLSAELNRDISFMPEFLTQRTADEDFARQTMIFTKHENLLKQIFIGKKYILMSSREAETAKYAHNVFGALKVTFFNGVYEYCRLNKCSYQSVLKGVLSSGYINDTHTAVPGPDGKKSYGGKCFPKDVNAFLGSLDGVSLKALLSPLPSLNEHYREGNESND